MSRSRARQQQQQPVGSNDRELSDYMNDARQYVSNQSSRARRFMDDKGRQARQFVEDYGPTAVVVGVPTALGLGVLNAYSGQANEYLPTDPLAVAGRMASNTLGVFNAGGGTVGTDPLASARNHVATAGQLVGTDSMLEALAVDQVRQMRDQQKAAMVPSDVEMMGQVQAMVDARAAQLMQTPIRKADGSVGPMPYDQAQRFATEQINMELTGWRHLLIN